MTSPSQIDLNTFMSGLEKRNPGDPEFKQAVREVAESVLPFVANHPEYQKAHVFERMTEPDRVIIFRVCWEDDEGNRRHARLPSVKYGETTDGHVDYLKGANIADS